MVLRMGFWNEKPMKLSIWDIVEMVLVTILIWIVVYV